MSKETEGGAVMALQTIENDAFRDKFILERLDALQDVGYGVCDTRWEGSR